MQIKKSKYSCIFSIRVLQFHLILICFSTLSGCIKVDKKNVNKNFIHESIPSYKTELINVLNADPESRGFGQMIKLDLLPNGNFYINDIQSKTLFRYIEDGELVFTFKNEGRGPGEFLLMDIKSNYDLGWMGIYDPILSRITLMDLELRSEIKSFDIDNNWNIPLELLGLTTQGVFFKGNDNYTLQNYEDEKYLKILHQKFESDKLVLLDSLPATEYHATVSHEDRSMHLNYLPLGRKVSLNMHEDHFIYISNDGFGYTKIDQSGEIVDQDTLPAKDIKPYSLTDGQFDQHVRKLAGNSMPNNIKSEIISELRSNSDKKSPIWFQHSFVDLNGRIWFELPSLLFDNESRWIVWDRAENDILQVVFEKSDVNLKNALDNKVIAFRRNEYDLVTVLIYKINSQT